MPQGGTFSDGRMVHYPMAGSNRYLNPELGRWLNRDPLPSAEFRDGPHLYWFARNSPVTFYDLLGRNTSGGIRCNEDCELEITGCDTFPGILQSCCRAHEQVHIDQMKTGNADWCSKDDDGCCKNAGEVPSTENGGISSPLWPDIECKAHAAEIECLKNMMGPFDEIDELILHGRINRMRMRMRAKGCPQEQIP